MQSDLEGLSITPAEVAELSQLGWFVRLRPLFDIRTLQHWILKQLDQQLGRSLIVATLLLLLTLITLGLPLIVIGLGLVFAIGIHRLLKRSYPHFINLLHGVEKHNQIIRDIDILDQLEAVGNPVSLSDRASVIEALNLTRADLIRALKTERILRQNRDFNPDRFAIDLSSLRALQISDRASQYSQLLNDALQIAVDVQQELTQFQAERSPHQRES